MPVYLCHDSTLHHRFPTFENLFPPTTLAGKVEQHTEENHRYFFGNLNNTCFEKSLDTFAKSTYVSRDNPIVLILDAAHRAKTLKIPEGIHFHFLPPYDTKLVL